RDDGETSRHRLLPLPNEELRLLLGLAIGDRQLDVLRADAFLEHERSRATIVARVRALSREDGDELVLAGFQVADEEPLHAALEQRFRLALRVEVVRDVLAVDLELYGIEAEELADVHRDEHGRLRV